MTSVYMIAVRDSNSTESIEFPLSDDIAPRILADIVQKLATKMPESSLWVIGRSGNVPHYPATHSKTSVVGACEFIDRWVAE